MADLTKIIIDISECDVNEISFVRQDWDDRGMFTVSTTEASEFTPSNTERIARDMLERAIKAALKSYCEILELGNTKEPPA